MGRISKAGGTGIAALVIFCDATTPPATAQDRTIEEIIGILEDRELIGEEEAERLRVRHASEEAKRKETASVAANLAEGWDWYGDLRLRHEAFWFSRDDLGAEATNRYRFRYRARMGFEKELTDYLKVGMRFASGGEPAGSDNRSTNQTLGRENDFDYDSLWIERAYVKLKLPEVGGIQSTFLAGKISNPFVWKHGKDFLIWDSDIAPEGGAVVLSYPLSEQTSLFANAGFFIDDENFSSSDVKLYAGQVGGTTAVGDTELGLRGSWYEWRSVDADFITRAAALGNLSSAYDDGRTSIGSLTGFVRTPFSDDWPLLIYGTFVQNLQADDAVLLGVPTDEEDVAWGVGMELGSSKRVVKLGLGYFYVESNAVVSIFTDSDLFDGRTNRKGWVAYGSRKLADSTELKLTFFSSDSIEDDGAGGPGPFDPSLASADRRRLQTDLIFEF